MRPSPIGRGKVGIIELQLHELNLEALHGLRFETLKCDCPDACGCVRAVYFDGPTVDRSTTVIEQEEGEFYLVKSPEKEMGYYVSASGTRVAEGDSAYCFPGRQPKAIMKGPAGGTTMVYRLPGYLRAEGSDYHVRTAAS